MSIFTDRLKQRISDLGLSNAEVARRAALDPRRFGHYITGQREPDFQTLVRICRVLKTDANALLGFADLADDVNGRPSLVTNISLACEQLPEGMLRIVLAQVNAVVDLERSRPSRRSR